MFIGSYEVIKTLSWYIRLLGLKGPWFLGCEEHGDNHYGYQ
jgi:hypothetical protein